MKMIVTGAQGQLGTDLMRLLPGDSLGLGHADLDITDAVAVSDYVQTHRPAIVINCAAYNKVDQAEDEPEVAYRVNALGPRNLAAACEAIGATIVHVSSDYVYGLEDSRITPLNEHHVPSPANAYAVSKLSGEHFVRSCCHRHYVIRTCGVYGHAARDGAGKGNFVETMIRLGNERNELSVVNDQFCTPTASIDLAAAIISLLESGQFGLYHFNNEGRTTWHEFACEIFRFLDMDVDVSPILSSQYPTKAVRPPFSQLDVSKYEMVTGDEVRHWKIALRTYLIERVAMLRDTVTV